MTYENIPHIILSKITEMEHCNTYLYPLINPFFLVKESIGQIWEMKEKNGLHKGAFKGEKISKPTNQ
ncbi:23582_t:CDS:2 [Gigaspora rosea]|nr:23582_t:CDS:2 [Gigaspora rosea]